MTSRRRLLLSLLSLPVPAALAGPTTPLPPPSGTPLYRTQAGTAALPYRYPAPAAASARLRLAYWNEVALQTQAFDHTPPTGGTAVYLPEQLGPTRASRALAIVQIGVHDALAAIYRRYPGYAGTLPAFGGSSPDAAIAQAAHDTLVSLYPRQAERLQRLLREDLARLPGGRNTLDGVDIGRRAAAAILALRADDGTYEGEPVVGEDYPLHQRPGLWRPDPVSRIPIALGAHWDEERPFVMQSAARFRPPPPPAMDSAAYAQAFDEVMALGGDGVRTPTRRTAQQTAIGLYWAYDGVAWLGTPPRLYNQIAIQLALARCADVLDLARALALVNAAIADATIAVWDAKYAYVFWRPVMGIREASPGTGPTGLGDGNPATHAAPGWTPLGAPASNLVGRDFTPPFPAYPSGHAGLGSAAFQVLRRLYGDQVPFTFVSDELNGITRDNDGAVRPRLPRSFRTLSQAEEENGQSRIYLGIHWQFDKTVGSALGRRVADHVFQRGLVQP
jgi:membrane-associated phospholipid phosphatase